MSTAKQSKQTTDSHAILAISSNAGLGYAPVAPGTFGTLAGIPVFYAIASFPAWLQLLTIVTLTVFSFWVCDRAGQIYAEADDGRIVFDELIGYLFTVCLLPFSWGTALLGFFWFRVFDIIKPPPVNWIDQRMKNGIGVTLDDAAAGIYAAIFLRLTLAFLS